MLKLEEPINSLPTKMTTWTFLLFIMSVSGVTGTTIITFTTQSPSFSIQFNDTSLQELFHCICVKAIMCNINFINTSGVYIANNIIPDTNVSFGNGVDITSLSAIYCSPPSGLSTNCMKMFSNQITGAMPINQPDACNVVKQHNDSSCFSQGVAFAWGGIPFSVNVTSDNVALSKNCSDVINAALATASSSTVTMAMTSVGSTIFAGSSQMSYTSENLPATSAALLQSTDTMALSPLTSTVTASATNTQTATNQPTDSQSFNDMKSTLSSHNEIQSSSPYFIQTSSTSQDADSSTPFFLSLTTATLNSVTSDPDQLNPSTLTSSVYFSLLTSTDLLLTGTTALHLHTDPSLASSGGQQLTTLTANSVLLNSSSVDVVFSVVTASSVSDASPAPSASRTTGGDQSLSTLMISGTMATASIETSESTDANTTSVSTDTASLGNTMVDTLASSLASNTNFDTVNIGAASPTNTQSTTGFNTVFSTATASDTMNDTAVASASTPSVISPTTVIEPSTFVGDSVHSTITTTHTQTSLSLNTPTNTNKPSESSLLDTVVPSNTQIYVTFNSETNFNTLSGNTFYETTTPTFVTPSGNLNTATTQTMVSSNTVYYTDASTIIQSSDSLITPPYNNIHDTATVTSSESTDGSNTVTAIYDNSIYNTLSTSIPSGFSYSAINSTIALTHSPLTYTLTAGTAFSAVPTDNTYSSGALSNTQTTITLNTEIQSNINITTAPTDYLSTGDSAGTAFSTVSAENTYSSVALSNMQTTITLNTEIQSNINITTAPTDSLSTGDTTVSTDVHTDAGLHTETLTTTTAYTGTLNAAASTDIQPADTFTATTPSTLSLYNSISVTDVPSTLQYTATQSTVTTANTQSTDNLNGTSYLPSFSYVDSQSPISISYSQPFNSGVSTYTQTDLRSISDIPTYATPTLETSTPSLASDPLLTSNTNTITLDIVESSLKTYTETNYFTASTIQTAVIPVDTLYISSSTTKTLSSDSEYYSNYSLLTSSLSSGPGGNTITESTITNTNILSQATTYASASPVLNTLSDSSTAASINPYTTLSINPSTTSINPNTTVSISASTIISIDASTTVSINPSIAISIDASTTISIDPSTTSSINPSTTISINPHTTVSINPSTTISETETQPLTASTSLTISINSPLDTSTMIASHSTSAPLHSSTISEHLNATIYPTGSSLATPGANTIEATTNAGTATHVLTASDATTPVIGVSTTISTEGIQSLTVSTYTSGPPSLTVAETPNRSTASTTPLSASFTAGAGVDYTPVATMSATSSPTASVNEPVDSDKRSSDTATGTTAPATTTLSVPFDGQLTTTTTASSYTSVTLNGSLSDNTLPFQPSFTIQLTITPTPSGGQVSATINPINSVSVSSTSPGTIQPSLSSSSSQLTPSTATFTPASSSTTPVNITVPPPIQSSLQQDDKDKIIGITVGVIGGAFLVIAALVVFHCWRKREQARRYHTMDGNSNSSDQTADAAEEPISKVRNDVSFDGVIPRFPHYKDLNGVEAFRPPYFTMIDIGSEGHNIIKGSVVRLEDVSLGEKRSSFKQKKNGSSLKSVQFVNPLVEEFEPDSLDYPSSDGLIKRGIVVKSVKFNNTTSESEDYEDVPSVDYDTDSEGDDPSPSYGDNDTGPTDGDSDYATVGFNPDETISDVAVATERTVPPESPATVYNQMNGNVETNNLNNQRSSSLPKNVIEDITHF